MKPTRDELYAFAVVALRGLNVIMTWLIFVSLSILLLLRND